MLHKIFEPFWSRGFAHQMAYSTSWNSNCYMSIKHFGIGMQVASSWTLMLASSEPYDHIEDE